MNISQNFIYICHYCLLYKSCRTADMKKHFNKKKCCELNYSPVQILSRDEAYKISLERKYYFMFDNSHFTLSDYTFLISYFTKSNNYIYENEFYQKKNELKNIIYPNDSIQNIHPLNNTENINNCTSNEEYNSDNDNDTENDNNNENESINESNQEDLFNFNQKIFFR